MISTTSCETKNEKLCFLSNVGMLVVLYKRTVCNRAQPEPAQSKHNSFYFLFIVCHPYARRGLRVTWAVSLWDDDYLNQSDHSISTDLTNERSPLWWRGARRGGRMSRRELDRGAGQRVPAGLAVLQSAGPANTGTVWGLAGPGTECRPLTSHT